VEGEARVTIGGATFRLKQQFFDDLAHANMQRTIEYLGRSLLVLHSSADQTIHIENAMQIFAAARHPKSFVSLDNADHLLSNQQDSWYAGEVIAAWASRWLRQPIED